VQVCAQITIEQVRGQSKAIEMQRPKKKIIASDRKFTVSREAQCDQPERQADHLRLPVDR